MTTTKRLAVALSRLSTPEGFMDEDSNGQWESPQEACAAELEEIIKELVATEVASQLAAARAK